jgi:hypothetical protein
MIHNANHSRSREPALSEAEGDPLFVDSIAAQENPRFGWSSALGGAALQRCNKRSAFTPRL